jgi:hypothetical protein
MTADPVVEDVRTDVYPNSGPVEPRFPHDHLGSIEVLRSQVLPPRPDVIPGLLPVGVIVLWAAPGIGKTSLARLFEHHLAHQVPMGEWEIPEDRSRVLILDGESDLTLFQDGSFETLDHLDTDGQPERVDDPHQVFTRDERGEPTILGSNVHERFQHLRIELDEAAEAGRPFRYVRIDTFGLFIGAKPPGSDSYHWENQWIIELNRLAIEYSVAILVLHHANKAGVLSGSTGISGGATTVMSLTRHPDNPHEVLLRSEKTRRGAPFEFALIRTNDRPLAFSDNLTGI